MLTTFAHTLWVNMVHSREISDTSHRFPTSITPTDATFSIWGDIYYRLVRFVCAPVDRTAHVRSLFDESCRLNRQWVQSFVQRDWASCQAHLKALERTLRSLRDASTHPDDQHLFDVYRTWVSCAALIQDAVAQRYSHKGDPIRLHDDGWSKLCHVLRNPHHNRTERGVFRWLLHGLVGKLRPSEIRRLPRAYRRIRPDPAPFSDYIACS